MGRRAIRKESRAGLGKAMLLPLTIGTVRALSLEHHMALSAVQGGHGTIDLAASVVRFVNLAYLMDSAATGGENAQVLRDAEKAISSCVARVQAGEPWSLIPDESSAIEQALALHDEQLASYPSHRYADAWNRYRQLLAKGELSAISRVSA